MKKLLFITHQLTLGGAPLVLMDMIRVCRDAGYEVAVISLMGGELSAELDRMDIPWRVEKDFIKNYRAFFIEAHQYSAVIVNTLVAYPPIIILNHTRIPTIWWIHESEDYFEIYDKMGAAVPDLHSLKSHIRILSVSPTVQEIFHRRYGIETQLQPFCVPEYFSAKPDPHAKIRFLTLAMFCRNKGQDILAEAIRQLPEEIKSQCEFDLYGGAVVSEPNFRADVERYLKNIPNAHVHQPVSRSEALEKLAACDFCVIPSRAEPFSAVAVEAMMLRKPCIITDVCGAARYLKDGESACFSPAGNTVALCDIIRKAVVNYQEYPDVYRAMGNAARNIYEKEFTPERFRSSILQLLSATP